MQISLSEEDIMQRTGLISSPKDSEVLSDRQVTSNAIEHIGEYAPGLIQTDESDPILPDQMLLLLKSLVLPALASGHVSSPLNAKGAASHAIQHIITSSKLSKPLLLSILRSYYYRPNDLTKSNRYLLLACAQHLLDANPSIELAYLRLVGQSISDEQFKLSIRNSHFINPIGLTLAREAELDISLVLRTLLVEYSSLSQTKNLFYAQKLLDYIWCGSDGPSLGALTLSTIGPSLYTFHKPVFDNSLAVFAVTLGSPNTVLCDPISLPIYTHYFTNCTGSKITNGTTALDQLEALRMEESNSAIYSYNEILDNLGFIPTEYLNPLVASGNMTKKVLQQLKDSLLYTGELDQEYSNSNAREQLNLPIARVGNEISVSNLLTSLTVIRGISLISNSNLYAYTGRMFVAEHMDPFSLGCCLPGMAYRLALFHGFPKGQRKVAEKYALGKFYACKPELFLLPTPWEDKLPNHGYSLPRRVTPTHSDNKKIESTKATGSKLSYIYGNDSLRQENSEFNDKENDESNALMACSFSLSDERMIDFGVDDQLLTSDFDDGSIDTESSCAHTLTQHEIQPHLKQKPTSTSFLGDDMYFCNNSCYRALPRSEDSSVAYDSQEQNATIAAQLEPLQKRTFPSMYRDSVSCLEHNQDMADKYAKNVQQVADAQKKIYNDMLANELNENFMYLTPPILRTQVLKTEEIPDVHLLTKCLTGRYSYAKRAAIFLVGAHGHTPCCFYGQRNRFLLIKNRTKLYTQEDHDRESQNIEAQIKKRQIGEAELARLQQHRALLRPFLSTPRVNDPNITPVPINLLRNKDPKSPSINIAQNKKASTQSTSSAYNQDNQPAALFRTHWVLRELPTVALLGQMHPLPSFTMQLPEKKHIRRVQAAKFADYRSKLAAVRGEFDDSEAVRHLDRKVLRQAFDLSESEEKSHSVSYTDIPLKDKELCSNLGDGSQQDVTDMEPGTEPVSDDIPQSQQKGIGSSIGLYRKGPMYQCDTISHVLSTWNLENFIKRRILHLFDRLVDESPTETYSRGIFADITAELCKILFRDQFLKELCKYMVFNSRYYVLNVPDAPVKKINLKLYSDPIEILMFENVCSTGGFVDNFMRRTSCETYLLQAVISEQRPGSFLLDRFIGWTRLILSYYTDYRASYLQAIRDMRFLLTYSHADIAGILSFGSRRLKYGANIDKVEASFSSFFSGQYDMLFKNQIHFFPYSMQQKESIISMLNGIYSVISSSLASSTFYPMGKVYSSPYPTIGLYARFIRMGEGSIPEDIAKLQVSEEKLKQYIAELSSLEPPMELPNVICHAKMVMPDKDKASSKTATVLETLRLFGIAIHELLAFLDMIAKTTDILSLDRNMFSVLETGHPSEFLFRYRLYTIAKQNVSQSSHSKGASDNLERQTKHRTRIRSKTSSKEQSKGHSKLKIVCLTADKADQKTAPESEQKPKSRPRSRTKAKTENIAPTVEIPPLSEEPKKHMRSHTKKSSQKEGHSVNNESKFDGEKDKPTLERPATKSDGTRTRIRVKVRRRKKKNQQISSEGGAESVASLLIPQAAQYSASLTHMNELGDYMTTEALQEKDLDQAEVDLTKSLSKRRFKSMDTPDSVLYTEFFTTKLIDLLTKYSYFLETEEGQRVLSTIDPIEGTEDVAMLSSALGKKIACYIHPFDVYDFCLTIQAVMPNAKIQATMQRVTLVKYVFAMIELLSRSCITQFLTLDQMYALSTYQLNKIDRQYRERDMFLEIKMHKHIDFLEGKHNGIIDDNILKVLNEFSEQVLVESVFGDGKMRTIERHRIALGEIPCYLYTDSPFMSIQSLGHSVRGGEIRGNYLGGLILNKANGCQCIPDLNICRYSGSFNVLTYNISYLKKYLGKVAELDQEQVLTRSQSQANHYNLNSTIDGEFQRSFVMHTAISQNTSVFEEVASESSMAYPYHVVFPIEQQKIYLTNTELLKRIERYKYLWTPEQNRAFFQLSLPMVQLTSANRMGTLLVFPHSSFKRMRSLSYLLSPSTFSNSIGRSKELILNQKANRSHQNSTLDSAIDRYQYVLNHPIENRTQVELIFDYWSRRRFIFAYGNIIDWSGGYKHNLQTSLASTKYPYMHPPELSPTHYLLCRENTVIVHNINMYATHYSDFTRGNMNLVLANGIRDSIQSYMHLFPLLPPADQSSNQLFPIRGGWVDIIAAPGDSLHALQITPLQTHLEAIVSKKLKYEMKIYVVKLVKKMGEANVVQIDGIKASGRSLANKAYDLDEQSIFHIVDGSLPEIYKDFLELADTYYRESVEVTLQANKKSNVYIFNDPLLLEAVSSPNSQGLYKRYTNVSPIYYNIELFKSVTDAALTREDIQHASVELSQGLIHALQYNDSVEACAYDCLLNFLSCMLNEESTNTINQRIAQAFGRPQCLDRGSRRGDLSLFNEKIQAPIFISDVYETVNQMELRADLPIEAFLYMIRSLRKAVINYLHFYIPDNSIVYGKVVATEDSLEKACASAQEATYGVFLPIIDLIRKVRLFYNQFWRRFSIMTAGYLYSKVSSVHVYGGFLHKHQMCSITLTTIWQLENLYLPLYRNLLAEDVVLVSFRQRNSESTKKVRAIKE